ncbi:MAG TPA: hypothetical protein PLI95_05715 [Polyangiaceae bacterium]|nr:hypothetical protein [Polyangiaceae bacterium]
MAVHSTPPPRLPQPPVALSRRAALLSIALLSVACSRRRPDSTPEGVVREWIERMQRVHGEPEAARAAFELLSQEAKANLEERARRASAATGRKMAPEQMIAPSRFSVRFPPRQLTARIAGDRAIVEAVGADPEVEHAAIPCVRESGAWRIDLTLPPLSPIERRPDAGVP